MMTEERRKQLWTTRKRWLSVGSLVVFGLLVVFVANLSPAWRGIAKALDSAVEIEVIRLEVDKFSCGIPSEIDRKILLKKKLGDEEVRLVKEAFASSVPLTGIFGLMRFCFEVDYELKCKNGDGSSTTLWVSTDCDKVQREGGQVVDMPLLNRKRIITVLGGLQGN